MRTARGTYRWMLSRGAGGAGRGRARAAAGRLADRRHRAQGRRASAPARRAARLAHGAAQPRPLPGSPASTSSGAACRASGTSARPVPRPRPLQDRQRLARPPGRRRAAGRGRRSGCAPRCGPGDTVARLGGDEFTVLLEDLKDYEEARVVADRVLRDAGGAFARRRASDLYLSASIGIAMVPPGAHPGGGHPRRRRRDVPGQERGPRPPRAVRLRRCTRRRCRRLDVETRLRRGLGEDAVGGPACSRLPADRRTPTTASCHGFEALARWQRRRRPGC